MKNSRLFVVSFREIIYTLIFLILGILLIILLIYMFLPGNDESSEETVNTYIPGVYESCLSLEENSLTLQLTVDENRINSIELINASEAVAAVYPLIPSCLESIESQLKKGIPINELTVNEESKYTHILLTDAISELLDKATA